MIRNMVYLEVEEDYCLVGRQAARMTSTLPHIAQTTMHEFSHQLSPFSKRKLISKDHSIVSSGQNRLGGIPRVGLVDLRTDTCSGVSDSSSEPFEFLVLPFE